MMVTAMLILSLLLVVSYVGAAIWRSGVLPDSVSAMVFDLPRNGQWLWTAWMALVALTLAPALFEAVPENWGITAHVFVTSILFVAVMPLIKGEKNTAHNVLGIVGGIFSQVCVYLVCAWWLLVLVLMVALVAAVFASYNDALYVPKVADGKGVFIAESLCAVSLYGSLFTFIILD